MMSGRLVQIVPTLPPAVNGLGDYADLLGRALRALGVDSHCLVTDPTWTGERRDAIRLHQRRAGDLAAALSGSDSVVVHYVNYAYDPRRGWPFWLLDGLAEAIRRNARLRVIACFHETWAFAPPWRKAFWFMPRQRACARRLAALAVRSWTSNGHYAARIDGLLPPDAPRCAVLPVISNVGEPADLRPFAARAPRLVCFGRPSNRIRAYRTGAAGLARLCAAHGIQVIDDIGQPLPVGDLPAIPGIQVTAHGLLPAEGISALLATARFGLIDNGTGRLAKSGVFAAYASHGCAPVVETDYPAEDGLTSGVQMFAVRRGHENPAAVSAAASTWYRGHGLDVLARSVAGYVAESPCAS